MPLSERGLQVTVICLTAGTWTACGDPSRTADGRQVLTVWRHQTGDAEMAAFDAALARFSAARPQVAVQVQRLPEGAYTESITAAALARQLPCVLDVDQPTVPNFAWAGHLRPLTGLVDPALVDGLLPGAVGRYRGEVYTLGQFDAVLALFARKSRLAELGLREATLESPYTIDELDAALRPLAGDPPPLDLNAGWGGEWWSYGLGPFLQSAGADVLDRRTMVTADGVLNGPEAVRVGQTLSRWFEDGVVERRPVDDQAFLQGRAVLHYTGSWSVGTYAEAVGDDLAILPPPDWGRGPKVGSGSWQWGITRACPTPELAADFVSFLLSADEIAAMSQATGLVPTSPQAAAQTTAYREGGPWRVFFDMAERLSVPRPPTPGYPKVSAAVARALRDIRDGAPVQVSLDAAVDDIEFDAARARGYGFDPDGAQ